jgi:hypothetical protein
VFLDDVYFPDIPLAHEDANLPNFCRAVYPV